MGENQQRHTTETLLETCTSSALSSPLPAEDFCSFSLSTASSHKRYTCICSTITQIWRVLMKYPDMHSSHIAIRHALAAFVCVLQGTSSLVITEHETRCWLPDIVAWTKLLLCSGTRFYRFLTVNSYQSVDIKSRCFCFGDNSIS